MESDLPAYVLLCFEEAYMANFYYQVAELKGHKYVA